MAGKKYGLDKQYKSLGGAMNVQKANIGLFVGMKAMKLASKASPKIKKMYDALDPKKNKSKFIERSLKIAIPKEARKRNKSAVDMIMGKTSAKDKVKKGVLKTHNAIKDAVTSKAGIGATGAGVGYELGKVKKKMYGGAMKKMKIGGAAIKGKGAVVGGSGLQDEKLKPGKTLSVKQQKIASKAPPRNKITGADFKAMKKPKKASLGVLMDAGMRNKKVMGAGALGLLSMLAKKK